MLLVRAREPRTKCKMKSAVSLGVSEGSAVNVLSNWLCQGVLLKMAEGSEGPYSINGRRRRCGCGCGMWVWLIRPIGIAGRVKTSDLAARRLELAL